MEAAALRQLANIIGARTSIIAERSMPAVAGIIAEIIGAAIAIIAQKDMEAATFRQLANIAGAWISIITEWAMLAVASFTEIIGTAIAITAIDSCECAVAIYAVVIGTRVIIIAENREMAAAKELLAKVNGAWVAIVTIFRGESACYSSCSDNAEVISAEIAV
jgi:hypothetical protein